MNITQALMRNVGTCCLGVKGATQVEILREFEYRYEAQGRMVP